MNTTPAGDARRNDFLVAVSILVLLFGTATGSAYAMLVMAVLAPAMTAIFYRKTLGRTVWSAVTTAAFAAAAIAVALGRL